MNVSGYKSHKVTTDHSNDVLVNVVFGDARFRVRGKPLIGEIIAEHRFQVQPLGFTPPVFLVLQLFKFV